MRSPFSRGDRRQLGLASGIALVPAVANSDLLIMVSEPWLNLPLAAEHLVAFDIAKPLPAVLICVVTRARLPLTPAAQAFADLRGSTLGLGLGRWDGLE